MEDMALYHSPKIELRKSGIEGQGVFAKEKINKGELVINFENGSDKIISGEEASNLYDSGNDYMLQIDEDLYSATTEKKNAGIGDFLNHSCDPNCGIRNKLKIVAMRDIEKDEEVTFDYAMSESSDFEIPCGCGASECRAMISGEDWKRKDIQKKYQGYFSDYLAKKVEKENAENT